MTLTLFCTSTGVVQIHIILLLFLTDPIQDPSTFFNSKKDKQLLLAETVDSVNSGGSLNIPLTDDYLLLG